MVTGADLIAGFDLILPLIGRAVGFVLVTVGCYLLDSALLLYVWSSECSGKFGFRFVENFAGVSLLSRWVDYGCVRSQQVFWFSLIKEILV